MMARVQVWHSWTRILSVKLMNIICCMAQSQSICQSLATMALISGCRRTIQCLVEVLIVLRVLLRLTSMQVDFTTGILDVKICLVIFILKIMYNNVGRVTILYIFCSATVHSCFLQILKRIYEHVYSTTSRHR